MIEIQDLSFTYKNEKAPALQDICLSVPSGGFLGIIGPAGAGKTTLLRAISGVIPHHYTGDFYGSVKVNGMDSVDTPLDRLSGMIGMVFQDVESQIIFPSVEDEILYGLENFGVSREEIPVRMSEALQKAGIPDLLERSIDSLSGGQRQKVAIASILALKPQILVLDEPTGELDPGSSRQIFTILKELNEEQGITVILVEQKIMLLCEFARHLAVLDGGRIVLQGETREVLTHADRLQSVGVNCPRVTTLGHILTERTGRQQPVCVSLDEAESMVRGLMI